MSKPVPKLLAQDEDCEAATSEDVAQAEAEEAEAARLVEALEERVKDGDVAVTPDQIDQQRSLSRFARLRAEATRRRAEKTARAARLRACDALRDEIEGFATDAGEQYAKLLKSAEDALVAFITATAERNAKLSEWRSRMHQLEVPRRNQHGIPPAEHAHLAHDGDGGIIAGSRRLDPIDPGWWIGLALARVAGAHDTRRGIRVHTPSQSIEISSRSMTEDEVYGKLAAVDAPAPASTAKHFYLGQGGAVIARDEPFDAEEIKRHKLTVISRKESEQA